MRARGIDITRSKQNARWKVTDRTHPGNVGEEDQVSRSDDSLLIEHVELLGDGGSQDTSAKEDASCLRDEVRGGRK